MILYARDFDGTLEQLPVPRDFDGRLRAERLEIYTDSPLVSGCECEYCCSGYCYDQQALLTMG